LRERVGVRAVSDHSGIIETAAKSPHPALSRARERGKIR
jgi:hypothetical protein